MQYLEILKNNIINETDESVIAENFQYNIPAIINNMIPTH
jgi:hypothetical protein